MTELNATQEQTEVEKKPKKTNKKSFLASHGKDFVIIAMVGAAIWTSHQESMENIEKMNSILVKYESQIDKMILDNDKTHVKYMKNLNKALSSLSKEERKVLLSVYSIANEPKAK